MILMDENLNRKNMVKNTTFKALNRGKNQASAGQLLGRSVKSVQRYMKRWGMVKDIDGSYYYAKDRIT